MTIVKADLSFGKVITNTGSNYAYKLLDFQWITVAGVDTQYWMVMPGSTRTGDFVASGDAEAVTLFTAKYIIDSFDKIWVKDDRFKDGDFLISKDEKHVFLYRKENGCEKVWKLSGGVATFHSTLKNREAEYGTLIKLQRGWSTGAATYASLSAIKA